ncbi:hypothetical protein V8F33_005929 [Rhypophila sp. PSN 637]
MVFCCHAREVIKECRNGVVMKSGVKMIWAIYPIYLGWVEQPAQEHEAPQEQESPHILSGWLVVGLVKRVVVFCFVNLCRQGCYKKRA